MSQSHPNFSLCKALVPVGSSFISQEHKQIPREGWGEAWYPNAKPDRIKYCPVCFRKQPIAEFILPSDRLRTFEGYAVADIREWCHTCNGSYDPKEEEMIGSRL